MSEYKDVLKALATKLQKDRDYKEMSDGREDLDYVMNVRLQQDVIDNIVAEGLAAYPEASLVASKVAKRYLDGLIALAWSE